MSKQLAIRHGTPISVYNSRVGRGWTKEEAATKPVNKISIFKVFKNGRLYMIGNAKQCAKRTFETKDTIYRLAKSGRQNGNGIKVVKLGGKNK